MSFTPDSLARLYAMGAKAVASWRAAHEKDRHEALHVYRSDIANCALCESRAHDDLLAVAAATMRRNMTKRIRAISPQTPPHTEGER